MIRDRPNRTWHISYMAEQVWLNNFGRTCSAEEVWKQGQTYRHRTEQVQEQNWRSSFGASEEKPHFGK